MTNLENPNEEQTNYLEGLPDGLEEHLWPLFEKRGCYPSDLTQDQVDEINKSIPPAVDVVKLTSGQMARDELPRSGYSRVARAVADEFFATRPK